VSLDELYMTKQRKEQDLLNNHATFNEVQEAYKAGDIDLVTAMELQTQTEEYKRLKDEL